MGKLGDEAIDKLIRAGRIAKIVREEAAKMVKPGMKLVDLAEHIENRIRELGGEPAFPTNLSINEIAAHYTPVVNDKTIVPDNAVIKIDIGVHIDGYIADTATTVTCNPVYEPLLEATRKALEAALSILRPGIKAKEIGYIIEKTIENYGYKPVRNLTGHSIDQYIIHSGKSIPNFNDIFSRWKLEDGVYAIEPFATNGVGLVKEGETKTIYSIKKRRGRLTIYERRLFEKIWSERRTLPFCERWYRDMFSNIDGLRNTIKMLERHGVILSYPILIERGGGIVAQFEHTIVVNGNEIIVTTL